MRNVSELVLYIVSGPKRNSKGKQMYKFYLEEACSQSSNVQIRNFKLKGLPSPKWCWGNSSLFMNKSSTEKGCISLFFLFVSSAFILFISS